MSQDQDRYVCLNCSQQMEGLKCKIRCTRCGYFESCSDLEPAPPFARAGETPARPQALSRAGETPARPQRR